MTIAASMMVSLAVMPTVLIGSTAPLLRRESGLGAFDPGVAVTAFFVAAALTIFVGGHAAERFGARRVLLLSAGWSCVVLCLMGVAVDRPWEVYVLTFAAGVANGVTQPATNLAMTRRAADWQGIAFGVKYSSVPVATIVAGSTVPTLGDRLGWRWCFVAVAVMGVLVAWCGHLVIPREGVVRSSSRRPATRLERRGLLVLLAVAAGAATAPANALAAHLVTSAIDRGIDLAAASLLLSVCGACGIVSRLVAGYLIDRGRIEPLWAMVTMMAAGAVGFGLMGVGPHWALAIGAVVASGIGWGWPGALNLAIVRANPGGPGRASGLVGTGNVTGAASGPLLFSVFQAHASDEACWWGGALLTVIACVFAAAVARGMSPSPASARPRGDDSGEVPSMS